MIVPVSCSPAKKEPLVSEFRGAERGSVPFCQGGLQAQWGALLSGQHPLPLFGDPAG